MRKPRFVGLNEHRLYPQNWQWDAGQILFDTVIRGENLGDEIVELMEYGTPTLTVDGKVFAGKGRITSHRTTGSGPTAVHRIEMTFESDRESPAADEGSIHQKLDDLLAEVRALRAEVNQSRSQSPDAKSVSRSPMGASTLLDFDIPTDSEG